MKFASPVLTSSLGLRLRCVSLAASGMPHNASAPTSVDDRSRSWILGIVLRSLRTTGVSLSSPPRSLRLVTAFEELVGADSNASSIESVIYGPHSKILNLVNPPPSTNPRTCKSSPSLQNPGPRSISSRGILGRTFSKHAAVSSCFFCSPFCVRKVRPEISRLRTSRPKCGYLSSCAASFLMVECLLGEIFRYKRGRAAVWRVRDVRRHEERAR